MTNRNTGAGTRNRIGPERTDFPNRLRLRE